MSNQEYYKCVANCKAVNNCLTYDSVRKDRRKPTLSSLGLVKLNYLFERKLNPKFEGSLARITYRGDR